MDLPSSSTIVNPPSTTIDDPEPQYSFPFDRLPNELILEIADYLDVCDISRWMRSHRQFYDTLRLHIAKQAAKEDEEKNLIPKFLLRAAGDQNRSIFEAILERTTVDLLNENIMKTDPSKPSSIITTAIHIAALHCEPVYLRRILEKGGNVHALDEKRGRPKRSPIQRAATHGNVETLQVLLDFGADVNDCRPNTAGEKNAWTPLHLAVWNEELEAVKFLIKAGANPEQRMGSKMTILSRALNWVEGLKAILEAHDFSRDQLNDALEELINTTKSFTSAAQCLMDAGAIPTYDMLCVACGKDFPTPLQGVELLTKPGFRATDRNKAGLTALHIAADSETALTIMKEIPGIVNERETGNEMTPLEWMYTRQFPAYRENGQQNELRRSNQSSMAVALIKNGAEIFVHKPLERNVLFFAAEYGHVSAVEVILKRDPELIHSRDSSGNTPLHVVASSLDTGTVDCMELLLKAGCNVNAQNDLGQTALHCLSSEVPTIGKAPRTYLDRHVPSMKASILTQHKPNLFLRGRRDEMTKSTTALVEAISRGFVPSAKVFIEEGIKGLQDSLNLNDEGRSRIAYEEYLMESLQAAVEHGYFELVDRLLDPDTNLSIRMVTATTGDTIYHILARGVIAIGKTGYAITVAYRMLGYRMRPDWDDTFQFTEYTDKGRPVRKYLHIADLLCKDKCREEFVHKKNAAGYSALDMFKMMFPVLDWDHIVLEKWKKEREDAMDTLVMPNPVYLPTVDLDDLNIE